MASTWKPERWLLAAGRGVPGPRGDPEPRRHLSDPAGCLRQGVQRRRVHRGRPVRSARVALDRGRASRLGHADPGDGRVRGRRRVLHRRAGELGRPAVPLDRRRGLPEHLSRGVRRTGAAGARPRAAHVVGALARRPRLRAGLRGGRRRARVRRGGEHRRVVRDRRDEPRLSPRRPDDARVRGGGHGRHRPGRVDVAAARVGVRRVRDRRRDLPLPGGARDLRGLHAAGHLLAGGVPAGRFRRLATGQPARRAAAPRRDARLAGDLHAGRARDARARPLRAS